MNASRDLQQSYIDRSRLKEMPGGIGGPVTEAVKEIHPIKQEYNDLMKHLTI